MATAQALLQRIPAALRLCRKSASLAVRPAVDSHHQCPVAEAQLDPRESVPVSRRNMMGDIPGPRSLPGIGAMWQYLPGGRFYGLDLNVSIQKLQGLYGDVVQEEIVPGLTVLRLFNPNHFADVYKAEGQCPRRVLFGLLSHYNNVYNEGVQGLLTSHGNQWQQLRKEVQQHILQPKAVIGYAGKHVDVANDFVTRLSRLTDNGKEIQDFLPEIYKYVTEAVGTVCFDRRLGLLEESNAAGEHFIRAVHESLTLTQKELQLLPLYRHMPTPVFARFTSAQNTIRSLSETVLQSALTTDETLPPGRLATLLYFGSSLTHRQITTFLSEFFAAGVDTTGHYLAFSLYALARHQDVQEKLYNEIKHVTDTDMAGGALESMQYLRSFMKESLRVYPVAPGLGRTLQKDAVLAGYHVPAGTNVVLQYDMAGKDRRFVSNPEDFHPERWLRQNREKTPPFLTLPFGFGPRSCPGRRLAAQEVEIAIVKIMQSFRVEFNGGDLPITMQILNTPAQPLPFSFVRRGASTHNGLN